MKPTYKSKAIVRKKERIENNVKLSILIPTHKRPQLLKRALESIKQLKIPFKYEIIINDDTQSLNKNDFEFKDFNLTNFGFQKVRCHDISSIYKSLFRSAKGLYIWYLEDDDIALNPLVSAIETMMKNDIDLSYCNYFDHKGLEIEFKNSEKLDFKNFIETYNHYPKFQLSRFIFKRKLVKLFPRTNNLLNDWHLFSHLEPKNFWILEYIIYKQELDGLFNENISFKIKEPFFESYEPLMVDLNEKWVGQKASAQARGEIRSKYFGQLRKDSDNDTLAGDSQICK